MVVCQHGILWQKYTPDQQGYEQMHTLGNSVPIIKLQNNYQFVKTQDSSLKTPIFSSLVLVIFLVWRSYHS